MVRKGAVTADQCKEREGTLLLNPGWALHGEGHLRKLHKCFERNKKAVPRECADKGKTHIRDVIPIKMAFFKSVEKHQTSGLRRVPAGCMSKYVHMVGEVQPKHKNNVFKDASSAMCLKGRTERCQSDRISGSAC